jgi:hypothetical protein
MDLQDHEIRVYWREISYDELNDLVIIEVDVGNPEIGTYQAGVPSDYTQRAYSVLAIWAALGRPAGSYLPGDPAPEPEPAPEE